MDRVLYLDVDAPMGDCVLTAWTMCWWALPTESSLTARKLLSTEGATPRETCRVYTAVLSGALGLRRNSSWQGGCYPLVCRCDAPRARSKGLLWSWLLCCPGLFAGAGEARCSGPATWRVRHCLSLWVVARFCRVGAAGKIWETSSSNKERSALADACPRLSWTKALLLSRGA